MSKYQRQIARILKKWAATPTTTVEDLAKQNRWPAGAPSSKGGQFAPAKGGGGGTGGGKGGGASQYASYGSLFGPGSQFPGGESPKWAGEQNAKPPAPPPGAKPHLKPNDKGETVTVNYPTKPSDKASWTDPSRTATFVPGGDAPAVLNGVPMKPWASVPKSESEWANVPGQKLSLDARFPFEPMPGKSSGAGVIIREPDGRMWLTKPTNAFGGYQQTFPKGTVEHGLSMQASAIKETWEETGLQIKITGILGDYERTTSKARFYVAERIGGTPADMGWESQAVRLATRKDLDKLLNMGVDKGILEDLDMEGFFNKADKPAGKAGSWMKQERWPQGTPLGGQWKTMDGDGVTLPPTIAGGLTGSNSAYQKKANAAYAAAKAGNKTLVLDAAITLQKKVAENTAKGASSSHGKWTAQLSQFVTQVASDIFAAPKVQAIADRLSSITKLSAWSHIGGKPGGSNPGGMHQDAKGQKWLVKGNAQYTNGAVGGTTSDDRAKNEVLAARLMQAVGVGAPDMKLIDLEGKHGGAKEGVGSIGVASKWVEGGKPFNANDPAHLKAAQADYAVHAWLGNYDVMGMGYDNTVIVGGKAVNIDPGGAILFRAQGLPKDGFGKDASEWETMRKTSTEQKTVYGAMTKSDLQASASKLAAVTDDTIKELVKTHGPGDEKARQALAETLIARRDAILEKAGVKKEGTLAGAAGAPAVAAPAPVPQPPKVAQANTPAQPVGGLQKPDFDDTWGHAGHYESMSKKMLAAHAAGDMAALKAAGLNEYGNKAWPKATTNGKLMQPFHDALIADLEKQKDATAQALAAGKATITGTDGKTWVDDGKGVLQPVAGSKVKPDYDTLYAAAGNTGMSMNAGQWTKVQLKMWDAAITGDVDALNAIKPKAVESIKMKAALLGAMQAKAAPASVSVTPSALSTSDLKTIWTPIKEKWGIASDLEDYLAPTAIGPVKAMFQAALKGDVAAIEATKINTAAGGEVKAALLVALGESPDTAAPQARAAKPVVATPQPVPQPAPKVATAAAPNFDKAMLTSGTNMPSHNAKISQIKALFEAGDEKGILALKLGTNSYAPKQVQVANDALAALGSVHQVTKGQAANSHPALTGGTAQVAPTAQVAAAAPKPAKAATAPKAKPFDAAKISTPPNFNTMGAGGGPLSGVQIINDSNNTAVASIYAAAAKGDLEALKKLTFPEVNKATGQPTGKNIAFASGSHPSKHVDAYYQNLVNEVDLQLNPPVVTPVGQRVAAADWDGGFSHLKPVPAGKGVGAVEKTAKAGDYIILGSVKNVVPSMLPKENNAVVASASWKENVKKAYKSAPQKAKDTFGLYVSTSGAKALNTALRKGNLSATVGGRTVKQHMDDFKHLLVDIPEGSTFTRNMGMNGFGQTPEELKVKELQQYLLGAEKGTVVQEPGFSSSSWGMEILSDNEIKWRFTAGKGVKAYPAWLTTNAGEGESLFPPQQRYMILGAKKVGKTVVVDAILLPTID